MTQSPPSNKLPPIDRLIQVMAALRNPDGGCPWDLEQDFASIAPYTIEEAYEVKDAIDRGDMIDLRDELGDLLLQVVFHGQIAKDAGQFDFDAIATAITEKMIRRHPHVFELADGRDATGQTVAWEDQKAEERAAKQAEKGIPDKNISVLADVARALPALMRAEKLQKRAARVGFDWPSPVPVFEKLDEEIAELQEAIETTSPTSPEIREEMGDLLFTVVNLARKLKIDPEVALRAANDKFSSRFHWIEDTLAAQDKRPQDCSLPELEQLWTAAKTATPDLNSDEGC